MIGEKIVPKRLRRINCISQFDRPFALFLALSFLPVGHTTNAVLMASFLYFFLGVSRADFMGRLTRRVFLRYLFFTIVMVATVLSTTTWV